MDWNKSLKKYNLYHKQQHNMKEKDGAVKSYVEIKERDEDKKEKDSKRNAKEEDNTNRRRTCQTGIA